MSFFAKRSFAVTNVVSLSMYFGMFGSIFFLSQYMQNVLHNTPLQAGLKLLVWTGASMVVAPLAGVFSERLGSRPFMVAGPLAAGGRRWHGSRACSPRTWPTRSMIVPFIMAGAGMALVFAPSANAVLSSVRTEQAGQASGANNAIREVGGVLGVAVLASVFTGAGGYASPQAFVDGLLPAMWVGVAVLLAAGAPWRWRSRSGRAQSTTTADSAAEVDPRGRSRRGRRRRSPGSRMSARLAREAGAPAQATGPDEAVPAPPPRRRVPAAERREELIAAAVHEFARGGLHGTRGRAASLDASVSPSRTCSACSPTSASCSSPPWNGASSAWPTRSGGPRPTIARDVPRPTARTCSRRWVAPTTSCSPSDRDHLMLQHQSYAACEDEIVRARVRHGYAELVELARELSAAEPERLDEFFRHGMALNVAAALGVEELSTSCEWVQAELA